MSTIIFFFFFWYLQMKYTQDTANCSHAITVLLCVVISNNCTSNEKYMNLQHVEALHCS